MTVVASPFGSTPLTIILFGPMQVLIHDRPLPHLRSRKALWLLALLTLRHGRPVEREWLAGTLWPDLDQRRANSNLRVLLSDLRHALGDQSERLQSPGRHTISLNLQGADVDVHIFDAAMATQKREALQQAVTRYRGPLLQDCPEEWIAQERNLRGRACLQALQTLGDAALAAGDPAAAIDAYRRAVSLDPWREGARRGWMEALAKSGDINAALHVYRDYVEWLRRDPSAAPDVETGALYQRLRTQARRQAHPPSAVTAAETIVNPATPPGVSGYLPHPLTDLLGREDARIEVATKLRGSRLVTLTGPGGIGKTRLAIKVANESIHDGAAYADGVWLVALESLSEGRLVVAQIASVLGLREEPGRNLLEILTEHLRTKRLLLVLDNCEHLLEASAQVSAHLLRECVRVRILATSREALGIAGENVFQVPALPMPDMAHLPSSTATLLRVLTGYESVKLFVERAQAVQEGFAPTGSNAMAVAQVCSRLEGIPLAIELAAARVRALTVEQIAMRLDDHLSLLTTGNRAAQSRQQTLRATLDWSYALLSQTERLFLGRVSVFAGGWTLEAAEEVCSREEIKASHVLNLLASLVDKSLIVFEEQGRYRLLETVRQYAVEHLQASGEADQVRSGHRYWCLALAEEAETHLKGASQEIWLDRLEADHANLRAALMWSGTDVPGSQVRLRLAGALLQYWQVRGHYSEGQHFLERALTGEEAPAATQARAKALYGAGALALVQSEYVSARRLLEESLSLFRQLGDRPGIARAIGGLGEITGNQGDLVAAKTQYEESLRLFRELGYKSGIATMLVKLGEMALNQGDLAAARVQFEESLLLHRELGNRLGISNALFVLGNAATMQGDYVIARIQLEESLLLRRELGNKYGIATALSNLAKAAALQGDLAAARAQFEESLLLHRELGNRLGIAVATGNLGNAAMSQSDYVMARTQLEESLLLFRELGYKQGVAYTLVSLGNVVARQGDTVEARTRLEEGLRLCRELGDKQGMAYALGYLGRSVAHQGDTVEARTQLEEGLRLCRELGDRRGMAQALENFAEVLSAEMENKQAARLVGAAQALRKTIHSPLPSAEQEQVDHLIARTRSVLGAAAFTEAWEEGSAMTLDQAVNCALNE